MSQNRLNRFVVNAYGVKIRRESAAERVPPLPAKGCVQLEAVPFGFVVMLRTPTYDAFLDRRLDGPTREIVEVEGLLPARIKNRTGRQFSHALAVALKRLN